MSVSFVVVAVFTIRVNAFRCQVRDLFLLQTGFAKYRSLYVAPGYILAFSASTLTHWCSYKNGIPEKLAGFFRAFNMCFFTLHSFEMEDLLPYQVDFFLPFFVHAGMSVQICSRVRGSLR